MAEYILPLDPAFLSPDTGWAGCLHDTRLCRAPDTDQSCQIELGDNQGTTRVRENHPPAQRMFCLQSKVVNYTEPQLGQNLAAADGWQRRMRLN